MFEDIIEQLVGHGVGFVVVGGVAAAIQGSTRFTNDLDICYDAAPDNVHRLVRLLRRWRPYLRGVEPGLPFVLDVRALATTPIMTLTTSRGNLDLLDVVPGVGDYRAAFAASEAVTLGGTEFRSLRLDALIASKRAAGRPKDAEHLIELDAIRALRKQR
jgi:hypothetical protein